MGDKEFKCTVVGLLYLIMAQSVSNDFLVGVTASLGVLWLLKALYYTIRSK